MRRRGAFETIRYFSYYRSMRSAAVVTALSALAQSTRLSVYRRLVQVEPTGLAAGDIAKQAHVAPSSLSFHLKELSRAGLVHARHDGRFVDHVANFITMHALLAFLTDNCCGGEDCGVACAPVSTKNRRSA